MAFDESNSGIITDNLIKGDNELREIDAFHEIFYFYFASHIVLQTNMHYKKHSSGEAKSTLRAYNRWVDTTTDELYCFAVTLLVPHSKKNAIKLYWSTNPQFIPKSFLKTHTFFCGECYILKITSKQQ